ncbi:FtsB family cell division protein [Nitrolancea hollandica]|uniref:Septum formation initiator n=1 Tax=Nitrolancea hollandica Lb TaxID=1129897 RepID=I4EMU9_9BACT|nr:septum formation initiator family protein [Nitrolancea hollandica]CCF86012.1 Septum formation initiator [Nitrolancea hollandica Lb]
MGKPDLSSVSDWIERFRGRLVVLVVLIAAVYFVAAFGEQAWKVRQLRAEVAERQAAIAALEVKRDALKKQVEVFSSDQYLAYVEQVARRDLGLSHSDETTLLVHWLDAPDASPATSHSPTSTESPESNWHQWRDLITGNSG